MTTTTTITTRARKSWISTVTRTECGSWADVC